MVGGMKAVIILLLGQSVLAADKKPLIADPIVEKAIRGPFCLNKPKGELTKTDLEKVTFLYMNDTKLTDAGLKEVAKLQQLTWLNLNATKITDTGLKEVAKMKQLYQLHLNLTKVTKAGVAELQKVLPKCKIRY